MIPTGEAPLDAQNEKICRREAERLRLALDAAAKMTEGRPLAVMMHYPPLLATEKDTIFTEILEEYRVSTVVYGHLHGAGIQIGFTGEHNGISYHLVSCESIGFEPKEIIL